MTDKGTQTQDKFVLRLPDGMRDRIKSAAETNNRSMNSEIVATLEKAYPEPTKRVEEIISFLLRLPEDLRDEMMINIRNSMNNEEFDEITQMEKDKLIDDVNAIIQRLRK